MKWLGGLLLLLLVLVGVVYVVGVLHPERHTTSRSAEIAAAPEAVWQRIRDVSKEPNWRPEVRGVDAAAPQNGHTCFTEHSSIPLTLCVERDGPSQRVVRVADAKHQFGGTWTFAVQPAMAGSGGRGSHVTLQENADVYSPLWRGLVVLTGTDRTIRQYLRDLSHSFSM